MRKTVIVVLGLAVLVIGVYLKKQQMTVELPVFGKVSAFSLTDSAGANFDSTTIHGKVWVANFIFTSCEGICPMLSTKMAEFQRRFAKNNSVQFVSISVDPDTDTPQVLAEYSKTYSADLAQWHFLTGTVDSIKKIMTDGFLLGFDGEPVFHSERFVLVDDKQRIRGYYSIDNKADMATLPEHIAFLQSQTIAVTGQ
jgi:protein SCO1